MWEVGADSVVDMQWRQSLRCSNLERTCLGVVEDWESSSDVCRGIRFTFLNDYTSSAVDDIASMDGCCNPIEIVPLTMHYDVVISSDNAWRQEGGHFINSLGLKYNELKLNI